MQCPGWWCGIMTDAGPDQLWGSGATIHGDDCWLICKIKFNWLNKGNVSSHTCMPDSSHHAQCQWERCNNKSNVCAVPHGYRMPQYLLWKKHPSQPYPFTQADNSTSSNTYSCSS